MQQARAELETEAQLVERAQHDPAAFAQIYDRHYLLVLNYLYRRTLSRATAEELTSNTFFKALRGLPKFRCEQPIRAWLYRIATNELRMHWRWRRRHPADSLSDLPAAYDLAIDVGETERSEQQAEGFLRVQRALALLPQQHQTILALRYFQQLSLQEIAQVIGRPIGSVKSRLHRGLARLKDSMERSARDSIDSK